MELKPITTDKVDEADIKKVHDEINQMIQARYRMLALSAGIVGLLLLKSDLEYGPYVIACVIVYLVILVLAGIHLQCNKSVQELAEYLRLQGHSKYEYFSKALHGVEKRIWGRRRLEVYYLCILLLVCLLPLVREVVASSPVDWCAWAVLIAGILGVVGTGVVAGRSFALTESDKTRIADAVKTGNAEFVRVRAQLETAPRTTATGGVGNDVQSTTAEKR